LDDTRTGTGDFLRYITSLDIANNQTVGIEWNFPREAFDIFPVDSQQNIEKIIGAGAGLCAQAEHGRRLATADLRAYGAR